MELIGPKKLAMVLDTYKLWHYWALQSTTAESFIKISRTKQMIANLRSFDSGMSSPCQYQRKYTEEIKDNLGTGVWAQPVEWLATILFWQSTYLWAKDDKTTNYFWWLFYLHVA